jgi:hypothetical protein
MAALCTGKNVNSAQNAVAPGVPPPPGQLNQRNLSARRLRDMQRITFQDIGILTVSIAHSGCVVGKCEVAVAVVHTAAKQQPDSYEQKQYAECDYHTVLQPFSHPICLRGGQGLMLSK